MDKFLDINLGQGMKVDLKVTLLHRYVVSSDFDVTNSSQCCCYGGIMLYSL